MVGMVGFVVVGGGGGGGGGGGRRSCRVILVWRVFFHSFLTASLD